MLTHDVIWRTYLHTGLLNHPFREELSDGTLETIDYRLLCSHPK